MKCENCAEVISVIHCPECDQAHNISDLTDSDLPYKSRTEAHMWKGALATYLVEITKANRGIRRLKKQIERLKSHNSTKYGCHCDLEPGMEPDECVLDTGSPMECIYANGLGTKNECEYWRPVKLRSYEKQERDPYCSRCRDHK